MRLEEDRRRVQRPTDRLTPLARSYSLLLRLAGHLAEFAAAAAPGDPEVRAVRAEVNETRSAAEPSLMAKSIFTAAARDSR